MTVLPNFPQKYYAPFNQAAADANDAGTTDALVPVTNPLVLQDYMPTEVPLPLRNRLLFLAGYVWFSQANLNRAAKCCLAAVALSRASSAVWPGETFGGVKIRMELGNGGINNRKEFGKFRKGQFFAESARYQFFVDAIVNLYRQDVDMYHHDRALNAIQINGKKTFPQKYDDIPKVISKSQYETFDLVKKEFSWPSPVPAHVLDTVADFAIQTTPDEFWIAEYVLRQTTYDPVVYARFGDWHVEVARW